MVHALGFVVNCCWFLSLCEWFFRLRCFKRSYLWGTCITLLNM